MGTDVDQLARKIERLESLIGRAIPTLKLMVNHPAASPAQQELAKETLREVFAEQDEYVVRR